MKKKSKKIIAIVIAALAIIITGGVVAYLTDTDTATNTFTIGAVSIDLTEDNWNATNAQNVVPGQVVQKDPAIENTGSNPAYVYLKIQEPIVDQAAGGTGPLLTYTKNNGWTQLGTSSDSGGVRTSVYYYNTALASGATTTALFNNVTVSNFKQSTVSGNKQMVVTAYAIQSNDLPSGTTIATAYSLIG